MAHFIYGDSNERGAPSPIPYEKWNACKHWALHFYNVHTLAFISQATNDAREKLQAENEIVIGRNKLRFWERHSNYSVAESTAELKKTYKLNRF